MSKTAKSKKGFQNKTGEDDGNSFMINGAGLMERTNVESKRSKLSPHWGGARDPGVVDIGQTEYITRLTALRDSLIDQEQLYLAQALDRLRIHSLTNKNSSYRLRMNGDEVVKSPSTTQRKNNMVSTVEKFRQMRPKRQSPVILPLQGKPLLEKNAHGRPASEDITATVTVGSLTNRSLTESNVGEISSRSAPSKIDESVQSNLQRLIQPTSSIPNIGRKALKHQENLELKTRSLQNMRSRVYRNTGRQLASPFLPIHEVMAANVPFPAFTSPILAQHNSSNLNVPQRNASVNGHAKQDTNNTHRQEGGLQSDSVDIDQTEEYLLENYLDTSRPQSYDRPRGIDDEGKERGQSREGGRRGSVTRTPNSSQSKRRPHRKFPPYRQGRFRKHNTTDREAFTDGVSGNGSSKSYSYSVHKIANGYRNGVVTSFDYNNDSSNNYLSDTSYSTSVPNGYYLSTGEESDAETTDYSGTKLPAIHQGEGLLHSMPFPNRSNKFYRKMKSSNQSSPVEIDLTLRPTSVVVIPSADDEEGETINECEDNIDNNPSGDRLGSLTTKKHIVVDMPSIVFNSPSPTPLQSDMDNGTGHGHNSSHVQGHQSNASLRKTLKQQEIRRRELSNLLEDVKELNMRTEALSSQSLNDLDGVDE